MKWLRCTPVLLVMLIVGTPEGCCDQVVFSEIMFHPSSGQPEYIEISNSTATPLDIVDWKLSGGVDYTFPAFSPLENPDAAFLKPYERILLADVNEASLRAAYPTLPADVRVFGPWTGSLKNSGERITLRDKNGALVCTVRYEGTWCPAADGAGYSLVIKNADKAIDDWRNWTFGSRRGGTPGTAETEDTVTSIANPEISLATTGVPYVTYGDTWKYNDKNVDLGTAWRSPSYDDSAWPQGPGLFGFEIAALPSPGIRTGFTNSQQLTYYLRTRFTYNGTIAGARITIDQVLDDGAVYYLNGVELGRSGVAAGTVTFATVTDRTVSDAAEELAVITSDGSSLVKGTNVLAAEVHQISTSSSDVVFGMQLSISAPVQASLLINEVQPGAAGVGFVEFYNPGATPINLRDDYLTNDPANPKKYRIASDVVVPAAGLASVGFTESSLAASNPLKVYLVAADGATFVNAISASLPSQGCSIGRKPTGGSSWYVFTGPTRDAPNNSLSGIAAAVRLNEVHFAGSKTADWVELYNGSIESISLQGLFLCSKPDLSNKVALAGSIPAGGFASSAVAFPVSGGAVTVFLVNAGGSILSAKTLSRPSLGDSVQALPQGSDEWYAAAAATRDATNAPARNTSVVINEILYDPPSGEPTAEFVELYNRGTASVDVSGWRFVEGIDFTIPAGASIPANGYLVVAADATWMQDTYGDIPVVGDFTGHLTNDGERVRLVDAWGNLVNQADYRPGGNWPDLAAGGGSSMELRNPWMDNTLASAWLDSDQSSSTEFQHYSCSDVFRQLTAVGQQTDFKELHLTLTGEGHVILRNIQIRQNGTGANLIANGDKMSTDGKSASGWLAQGTHWATTMDGADLHLISDGHGDNRANRVEIDATGMLQGRTYEVSFDAKWVSGDSRLIVDTFDHSIATSISLPVPTALGTPGEQNSSFIEQPGPQLDGLMHDPAVPAPGQAVRVTAQVVSPRPSLNIKLYHRLDNSSGQGTWASKAMVDDGTSGDPQAGDGTYTATLTEYGQANQVVQFYVLASYPNGDLAYSPKLGPDRPALYAVDTPTPAGRLRRMRFVVSALDVQAMASGNGSAPVYGYAFPRLSNHSFNATLIVNEKDVFYNSGIRRSGSPWTRGGSMDRAKFEMPQDQPFRGKSKLVYRNYDVGWWSHDRMSRYWLYLLGNPANENEFILVHVNASDYGVREEMEPYGNDFLNRVYENGSQGELYKIDDEWWFTDDWSQQPSRNADWSYKGTDNPGRYRSEWMKRSRENEDDYSSLISFFKKVYVGPYTQAEIERVVDPDATLKACVVAGYIHAWDFFSLDRGKNSSFYRRITDGRFFFLPWDLKRSFDNAYAPLYNGMAGFRPWLDQSYNKRLFRHYLARMSDVYTLDSLRVYTWLQTERDFATSIGNMYQFNYPYETWFQNRQQTVNSELGLGRTTVFKITTNSGNTVTTSASTMDLAGSAPLRVCKVVATDHPEARFSWTSETAWSLTGILLRTGTNSLALTGVDDTGALLTDEFGTPLALAKITVNKTGNAPPVASLTADPAAWQIPLQVQPTLNASESFDPDGSALTYSWSVTPTDATLGGGEQGIAAAGFSHAGLYTFKVTATDAAGGSATIQREAAVYGKDGLSDFDAPRLESFWTAENVKLRANYFDGPTYSLAELEGNLVLQVWSDQAYPLAAVSPKYPCIWRSVPSSTEWAFLSTLSLRGQVFADYLTGLLLEMTETTGRVRYVFAIEDGTSLAVRKVSATGTVSLLKTMACNDSRVQLRVHRTSDRLIFEQGTDGAWTQVYSTTVTRTTAAGKVGLFIATDTAQSIKVAFEDAVLVDFIATQ